MKAILLATLLLAATLVVAAPAEARQLCTYGTGDPCDDQLVCAWNRLTQQWDCFVYVSPCTFRCW